MVRFFNVDDDNIMYGNSGADPAKFKGGGGGVHTAMIQTSQKRLGVGGPSNRSMIHYLHFTRILPLCTVFLVGANYSRTSELRTPQLRNTLTTGHLTSNTYLVSIIKISTKWERVIKFSSVTQNFSFNISQFMLHNDHSCTFFMDNVENSIKS